MNEIIGGMIASGVDSLNLQQPRALGIEEIGRRFAGKVCFYAVCDIQHTLPFKGKEAIEEEAALLLDRWGTDRGGFVLADYGDGEAIGVPVEKKQWMYDAFVKHDRWR